MKADVICECGKLHEWNWEQDCYETCLEVPLTIPHGSGIAPEDAANPETILYICKDCSNSIGVFVTNDLGGTLFVPCDES